MRLHAPWTEEQVEVLNRYQNSGALHPYTCGGNRTDDAHRAYAATNGGDFGQLIATRDGWVCPVCGYAQSWALASSYLVPVRFREEDIRAVARALSAEDESGEQDRAQS